VKSLVSRYPKAGEKSSAKLVKGVDVTAKSFHNATSGCFEMDTAHYIPVSPCLTPDLATANIDALRAHVSPPLLESLLFRRC
jgi:hypothetical protein